MTYPCDIERRYALVGRAREQALLDEHLHRAAHGTGSIVVLAGEPGVGKSRLAAEIVDAAVASGMRRTWGRALDDATDVPYWPVRQILQQLGDAGAGPEIALITSDVAAPPADASIGDGQRLRVFDAVVELLRAQAVPQGLVVVIDDAQWADRASRQLLVHLARRVVDSRILVLVTLRDTEPTDDSMRATLAALAGEPTVSRLSIDGLSATETGMLLEEVVGAAVPAATAAAVHARAGGNPFFITELGRALPTEPVEALPVRVRDAVGGRIAALSAPCRTAITVAAALGGEIDPGALAAVTGLAVPVVLAALDEAVEAGVMLGSTPRRFGHDLVRDAAACELPSAERAAAHQRMAGYLSGRVDAPDRAASIAFHLLAALPLADAGPTVDWVERAAAHAVARLAWEDASSLLGRAVELASDAGLPTERRQQLLVSLAQAQVRAYDIAGARRSVQLAVELARITDDAEAFAQAVLTMEDVTDYAWGPTGLALCAEALRRLPDADSAVRARLLAHHAGQAAWSDFTATADLATAAFSMAERLQDARALKAALRASQIARSGPGGVADRLALADRMRELGVRQHDDDAVLWSMLWRFDALVQLGRIDAAEADLPQLSATAIGLRSPLARWHSLRCRAGVALARGRFDETTELATQAVDLARQARHSGAVIPALGPLTFLESLTGAATDDRVAATDEDAPLPAAMRAVAANHLLAIGRRTAAERLYRAAPPPTSVPGFVQLVTLAAMAELAWEFDDSVTAAEIHRLLQPFADLQVCGGAGVVAILGAARLPLGMAAAATGRIDEAVRHMRGAVESDERAGMPPNALRAQYHLARTLARRRRPGDCAEAAALAGATAAVAHRLGMHPLHDKCQQLAESLSPPVTDPLTSREREIATLLSQGLTNNEIAAALTISIRTAENHIRNILGKLGLQNRTQVAAWLLRDPPDVSTHGKAPWVH